MVVGVSSFSTKYSNPKGWEAESAEGIIESDLLRAPQLLQVPKRGGGDGAQLPPSQKQQTTYSNNNNNNNNN